jgi:GrpB-like predicted nucleotidyltransferase (UPF0157 family)
MPDLISIADYNPFWPEQFQALHMRIAASLGELAATIDHVGSTAVPGLAAKPIIDIDVLLRSADGLPLVIARLARLGYQHQGDLGIAGREAFRAPAGDLPHHLYVCMPDSGEYRRHILFRDHLRAHPQDARAYANLKRDLAEKFAADREAYTHAKTEFVEQIVRCASANRVE